MAWECCSQRAGCLPDPGCLCPGPIRKSFVPWEGGWLVIISDALQGVGEFRLSASGLGGSIVTPRRARAGRFSSAMQHFFPRGIRECPWVCPAPGDLEVQLLRCSAGLWQREPSVSGLPCCPETCAWSASHHDLALPVNPLPTLDWHKAPPVLQSFPGTGYKQGERGAQATLLPGASARPGSGSAADGCGFTLYLGGLFDLFSVIIE